MANRIDWLQAEQVRAVLMLCRSKGLDPVAALDRAALLRHKGTIYGDQLQLLDIMIALVQACPADELVNPTKAARTPLDIKHEILRYLEGFQKGFITRGTEKH